MVIVLIPDLFWTGIAERPHHLVGLLGLIGTQGDHPCLAC
jgi:hypothetical protein